MDRCSWYSSWDVGCDAQLVPPKDAESCVSGMVEIDDVYVYIVKNMYTTYIYIYVYIYIYYTHYIYIYIYIHFPHMSRFPNVLSILRLL